jgi:aldose 1-epimerase
MVPWAGRVRDGSFWFAGTRHQLPLGLPPHAIHGTVYTRPWVVTEFDDRAISMSCPLGDDWPFGGTAHQRIELDEHRLRCTLSVIADQQPMPVQVGWHPWFLKPTAATLRFHRMYRRDASGLPTGEVIAPLPGPWDDCFLEPIAPIELRYEGTRAAPDALIITLESDADHWVIYDQPADATCVEPQSGPPDGFTLRPSRLEPGDSLSRWMTISWRPTADADAPLRSSDMLAKPAGQIPTADGAR